jgi:hypothetical protein
MLSQSAFEALIPMGKHFAENAKEIIYGIVGAGGIAILVRLLVGLAFDLHWIAGAILSIAFVAPAVWLTQTVKRPPRGRDSASVITVLSLSLMTMAAVCASISFALFAKHIGDYGVPSKYSAGTFMDFYMCTFFDLLPGVKVLETLHLRNPIEAHNFAAGLPVLAFKTFVIWLFLDAFRSWFKNEEKVPATS